MSSEQDKFKAAVLQYKYTSPTLSLLERLYLNEFWAKVAELYPRWLAPNLITLGGYVCVWIAFGVTLTGSPTLMGELPGWGYVLNAALFFAYQTLDGSDGKQARRTGSGSALGELMDHGVDAVVTTFLALIVSDCFKFGILSIWPWCFVSVALLSFFLSNMTLVHSGRQMFFDLDVMEIQTTMIITLVIAGVMGTEIFNTFHFPLPEFVHGIKTDLGGLLKPGEDIDFSSGKISLKMFIVLGGLWGIFFNYPQYLFACIRPYFRKFEDRPEHIKKGVPGSGFGSLLFHLVLIHTFFLLCCACVFFGTNLSSSDRSIAAMRSFAILVAFSFGDLMDRVLLMRVAHRPLPTFPTGLFPVIMFIVCAANDSTLASLEGKFPVLDTIKWWRVLAAASFVIHQTYFAEAVLSLAKALGIHPFKISPKKKE